MDHLSQVEQLAKLKIAQRCQTDLFFLVKYILAEDESKVTEQTHGDLCRYTQSLIKGSGEEIKSTGEELSDQFDPRKKFLLTLMPRGTFKSSVVTIGFTLQMILNDPDTRILIDSETFAKAKAFLAAIKGILTANEQFREIFYTLYGSYPDAKKRDELWTDSQLNVSARKRMRKEPTISCGGVDVTKNGMHYDLIIMDDLHSELNTANKEQIEKVKDHFKLALSLIDPGKPIIVIGTRWDYNDVYQYILDFYKAQFNILVRKAYNPDGSLFFPEVLTEEELQLRKTVQGSYMFSCNPAGSPILMSNWEEKNIEDIKVGDEVVGWNLGSRHAKSRLKPSKVVAIGRRPAQVVKVTTASGRVFRCTPDHNWYVGPSGVGNSKYLPAKVGRKLMVLGRVTETRRDEWLGGIFDGEGSGDGKVFRIAQSKSHNPEVCAEIERRLDLYGFKWGYNEKCGLYWINGGLLEKARFLAITRPIRQSKILASLWAADFIKEKDPVVSIEPDGEEMVYSMQTETGNYVCHGILSRNCQYMNEPVDDETATFKRSMLQRKSWELVKDRPMNWYLSVDPSYEGTYSDYAAFVICGMDHQRDLYVRYILRQKMTYADIIRTMFDLYTQYDPKQILLETVATQKSIQYELTNEQKRRGTWLPVTEIKSRSKSKEERIRGLAPYYEFGHIYHLQDCHQLDELEYELLHFPRGTHDDVIDALASVLEVASPPSSIAAGERKRKRHIWLYDKPRSPLTGV